MFKQKKKKNLILSLISIGIILLIPILIYIATCTYGISGINDLCVQFLEKVGLIENSMRSSIVNDTARSSGTNEYGNYEFCRDLGIGVEGDYVLGDIGKTYDWTLPWTVSAEQYAGGKWNFNAQVAFCCHTGWPVIKTLYDGMGDIDEYGENHEYPAFNFNGQVKLGNHDGHFQRVEYNSTGTFELSKAVAYALDPNLNGGRYNNEEIQQLIWNSVYWSNAGYCPAVVVNDGGTNVIGTTEGSVSLRTDAYSGYVSIPKVVRAQQYATFAYQILGNNNVLDIRYTPTKEQELEIDTDKELHVEVDQATNSFLVGPYSLSIVDDLGNVIDGNPTAAGQDTQTLGDFLYREITQQNYSETASNAFIKTRFIMHAEYTDGSTDDVEVKRNDNGTIAAQEESAKTAQRIVLTDENGAALPYGMPKFGEDFYIRYYVQDPMKNLKFLQPEIKFDYLDTTLSAQGTRETSIKALYSIHFSLVNHECDDVMSYLATYGYDYHRFPFDDIGSEKLSDAFFYRDPSDDRDASLQDGITAMKTMVSESNGISGGSNVIWEDDNGDNYFNNRYSADAEDRCDGIYIHNIDLMDHMYGWDFIYCCDYENKDALWEALKTEYTIYWDGGHGLKVPGLSMEDVLMGKGKKHSTAGYDEKITEEDFYDVTSNKCGCSEAGATCDCGSCGCDPRGGNSSCSCNQDAEYCNCSGCGCDDCDCEDCDCDDCTCDDCDCASPATSCSCSCTCKYRYDETYITDGFIMFYRNPTSSGEYALRASQAIWCYHFDEIKIEASDYEYDSVAEAEEALADAWNTKLEELYTEAVEQYHQFYIDNASTALYVPVASIDERYAIPFVEETNTGMQECLINLHIEGGSANSEKDYLLTKKEINEYLGGNVSENVQGIESVGGYQVNNVWQGSGIEVTLIDLGPLASSPEPVQPTPPVPPGVTPIDPPVPPTEPEEPEKPTRETWEIPEESETQNLRQCAMFAIANTLESVGYDVTPEEVMNWMVEKGYYEYAGESVLNPLDDYRNPSRANLIEYAQEYISDHGNSNGASYDISVEAFNDPSNGYNSMYMNTDFIINNLPQEIDGEIQWVDGKEYSAVTACYKNTPGITSATHYVCFNKYRYENGELQVYVMNSGQNYPSGWQSWSVISGLSNEASTGYNGQYSADTYDPSNIYDWGHTVIKYKHVATTGESMTDTQFNELMAQYEIDKAKYDIDKYNYDNVLKPEYDAKLAEYNNYINNILPQYNLDQAAYQTALAQYQIDLANYQTAHAAWEAQQQNIFENEKIVQITVTDKNGNYGFQRLNPLHNYRLKFRYDGMEYIADMADPTSENEVTEISDNISNRKTAYETDRDEVNERFENINASNMNYTGKKGANKAYGWFTKLRANDASFVSNGDFKLEPNGGEDNNVGAFRFVDAYDRFKQLSIEQRGEKGLKDIDQSSIQKVVETYDDIEVAPDITYEYILESVLPGDLAGHGVGTSVTEGNHEYNTSLDSYDETKQVANFIYDSLVTAETKNHFPDNSPVKFFLEDVGTGRNDDANNRNVANTDTHSNYNHIVCDDPFPVSEGKDRRRVNSLYNKEDAGAEQTINNRDQARNVDYTFKRREEANLVIGMDIEKVTLLVNGQKEIYQYGDLNLSEANVQELAKTTVRAGNALLNYNNSYSRVITESMYLYNGELVDSSGGSIRDLSMFITYKIVIKNSGIVDMNVGYIVDHYDSYYLEWDQNDQYRVASIVGAENCTASVTVPPSHPYNADKTELGPSGINNMYNELFIDVGTLASGEAKTMMITFEQTKDEYGRLNVNQDLNTGALLVGDKNVVEIDGYSTSNNDVFRKGLITRLSNIGNLCPKDFYQNGNKTGSLVDDIVNPTENRVEVDTASAPNLVIYIPSKGYIPCISGYTFEDVRSEESDKALIGNGKYNESDKDKKNNGDTDQKINGVTVQLVELVRKVDQNGLTDPGDDTYIKEKIWGTTTFTLETKESDGRRATENPLYIPSENPNDSNVYRYYSGSDKAQIILDVDSGYLSISNKVDEDGKSYVALEKDKGFYKFVNVHPGTFVVRFIYGDTTQTMLVKGTDSNEVNTLLQSTTEEGSPNGVINFEDPANEQYMFLKGTSDGYVSKEGLNSKSYNGNDYKSTVYQSGLSQDTSYEGIDGYKDYNRQNFTNDDGINMTQISDSDLLSKLYYYDINVADGADKTVSDAKDVYGFRQNSDNYAKGYISALTNSIKQDQKNAQIEILKTYSNEDQPDNHYSNTYDPDNYQSIIQDESTVDSSVIGENPVTLRNYRNEIMNSFYQIGTYTSSNVKPNSVADNESKLDATRQVEMLKELMKYTRMVAQSGIINFEIEYTIEDWASKNNSDGASGYIEVGQLNSGTPDELGLPKAEYTNKDTRTKHYHIKDLNLGLVERPEAQIRLNKNVSNVKISLSSGETLFDTSKSVNNLYYARHKAHTYKYINKYRLQSVQVTTNSYNTPELIQAYMDEELLENANLVVTYLFTVENIGEVDYLDKQFYYIGKTDNTALTNVSRTNVDEVLDYVSNKINFEGNISNTLDELRVKNVEQTKLNSGYEKTNWQVKAIIPEGGTAESIVDSKEYYKGYIYPFGVSKIDAQREQTPIGEEALDTLSSTYLWGATDASNLNADLVNREYFDRVYSYSLGSIITTDRLSTKKYNSSNYSSIQINGGAAYTFGLVPKALDTGKEENYKVETQLALSLVMGENEDLVFPNLTEAVRISNSVGRRCTYSTVGNQPMANQNYGSDISSEETADTLLDKYSTYNPIDVVTPIEVDADSSQSVRILPPTGFNKNNSKLYFAIIGALSIIIVSILMLKVGVMHKKSKKRRDIKRWK